MNPFRRLRHALFRSAVGAPLRWYRHRSLRRADVFLASYPRSGNTWLRFILCDLLTGRSDQFEWVTRQTAELGEQGRVPALFPDGGRVIKTHHSFRSDYGRAVCLVRDARDVVLSEHALYLGTGELDELFEPCLQGVLAGRV